MEEKHRLVYQANNIIFCYIALISVLALRNVTQLLIERQKLAAVYPAGNRMSLWDITSHWLMFD